MYGITRIDQDEKKNHGFYVRISVDKVITEKYFPDKSSGGKAKALKLAKAYRDELFAGLSPERQALASRKKRQALKSGVVGVTHVVSHVPAANSKSSDRDYSYWQAAWNDENGRRRTAKFSIARYGNEVALSKATKALNKAKTEVRKLKATKA